MKDFESLQRLYAEMGGQACVKYAPMRPRERYFGQGRQVALVDECGRVVAL